MRSPRAFPPCATFQLGSGLVPFPASRLYACKILSGGAQHERSDPTVGARRVKCRSRHPRRSRRRYRLVALYGWDDLVFTHISARIPGPEHHFLINPYGMMFEEITASSLVKIDMDGHPVGDSALSREPCRLHHPFRGA